MAQSPANVRVTALFPFPASVSGAAPIVITKQNGIWTVSFSFAGLGAAVPPIGNYPTDFLLVYDSVAQTYFKMPLTAIGSIVGGAKAQRSITTGAQLPIQGTDQILNINAATDLTPTAPLASGRAGAPITFNNITGSHSQTVGRTGADTFNGQNSFIVGGGSTVTITPYNDGVNAGYFLS